MIGSTSLGTLVVYLTANASQYKRAMKDVEASHEATMEQMLRTTKYATAAMIGTLAAVGAAGVVEFAKFESSFAGVRKTIDATEAQYRELSNTFRSMALRMPVDVNEINKVAEAAGQLGIKKENIAGFTETMIKLGVATNLSSEEAATALARIANITGMSQDEFDNLGSSIVALGNNFATTEAEITAMALRIAGAGKQVGLTQPQITGIAAALSSVGMEAEAGGTAISQTMIMMAQAVAKGTQELDLFASVAGMSVEQFKQTFEKDAAGAIITFVEGLQKIGKSGGNTFQVLENLGIDGIRLTDALLRASNAGDLFRNAIDLSSKAWKENNALTVEADKRFQTLISQGTILINTLKDMLITIGERLVPVIMAANAALKDFLKDSNNAESGVSSLANIIKTVLVTSIGVVADAFYGWRLILLTLDMAFTTLGGTVAWFCKSGEVLILSLSTVFEKALKGWTGILNLTVYGLKLGFNKFMLWMREMQISAAESLNKILPDSKKFSEEWFTPLRADVKRLNEEIAGIKAPDLDMTTANGAAQEQAVSEWKKFANEQDAFSERNKETAKKLWELAAQGAPSEKFYAAIKDAEQKMADALKAPSSSPQVVAAQETAKAIDLVAAALSRVTPELVEFRNMTRDPLLTAYNDQIKKFGVVIQQSQAQRQELDQYLKDGKISAEQYAAAIARTTISVEDYQRAVRDVLSQQNPFINPVAGMQNPTGLNQDADTLTNLKNQELQLTDSYNRKLQATQAYYAQQIAAAAANNAEVTRLEAEKQMTLEEMNRNYLDNMTYLSNQAMQVQLQATNNVLSVVGNGFGQMANLLKTAGKESSGAYKALFFVGQAAAAAMAIVNGFLAYTQMLASPHLVYPTNFIVANIALAGGIAAAGAIMGTTIASFEGGGLTPKGARAGGMDGKGGFLAMLHPEEKVVDLTKDEDAAMMQGQGGTGGVVVNVHNYGDNEVTTRSSEDGKMVDIIIKKVRDAISNDIATGRGPVPSAMQNTYKLKRT